MIRQVRDGDAEAVIALWRAAGVLRPWNDPAKDFAFACRSAHATVLAAETDDRLVATCMVGEDGHRGWVYYLAVDPARRGDGLGRAMIAAAERWLAERGVWKLQLLVRADNADVVAFYKHLGFRDTATVCLQKVIAGI
ncbi:GNAT family acetyltransferase [Methylobacterium nigriterrae]|uniref:GNAT family acetyltransferase n=1 Tax=Methylobacterium nigriterrae TaxID=3127512 RepID=UPI00301337CB